MRSKKGIAVAVRLVIELFDSALSIGGCDPAIWTGFRFTTVRLQHWASALKFCHG
jgi:hypothetical protein